MAKKTKRVSTNTLQDLVTRSLLIVFSVLLALFLDGIWEQQKVTANLTAAYRNIRPEVENNRATLAAATTYHHNSLAALDSLLEGNNRDISTTEFSGLLLRIFPNGLNLPDLQNAAWNTLHPTGLMANLKFEDVYPLAKLYQRQEGTERAWEELEQFIVQPERFEKQHNAASLATLRLLLNRLCEQEKQLLAETNTVLDAGQNWRYLE